MICPFCGGTVVRAEFISSAGVRAESLCCDVPTEFIDNYETFADLPEDLQQIAIERRKAEYAAMGAQDRENARRFRETKAHWDATHGHLSKEESNAYQG